MTGNLPQAGDELEVTVTAVKPFGAFVEAGSVRGLVRGASAAVGDVVRVRVLESDDVESRFSAELV
jgi:predicted RNA-binding protein with RPS1 domain